MRPCHFKRGWTGADGQVVSKQIADAFDVMSAGGRCQDFWVGSVVPLAENGGQALPQTLFTAVGMRNVVYQDVTGRIMRLDVVSSHSCGCR